MERGVRKIRVLHCITSLLADGAQHMLLKLCEHVDSSRFEFRVLNLRQETPFAERFRQIGIPVENLGMRPALPSLRALRNIGRAIDSFKPDLLQGWMYHGNIAALAGRAVASCKPPVIWNIRKAVESISEYRPLTRMTLRIGAGVSHRTAGIIYCGQYIASQHMVLGYASDKVLIFPNGFDTDPFRPSADAYGAVRRLLGLPEKTLLVGMTARYHPHKDHPNFLRGALVVTGALPDAHFVLAGRGLEADNQEIMALAVELGISQRLHLLGEFNNVERLLPAFDVFCLSSSAEGFPNSLGEAMACGVPCVTTDAGAAREVVGDTCTVVPVGDPFRLGNSVKELLTLSAEERRCIGARARERVIKCFSLSAVAKQYEEYYVGLAQNAAAQRYCRIEIQSANDFISRNGVV